MSVYDTREIGKVKIVMLAGSGGSGTSALTDLSDVNIESPTNGQGLIYNSALQKWINGNSSNTYTAGTGIDIINNVIFNTLPGARCGVIDSISSNYAHTEIITNNHETFKDGELIILRGVTSGTAQALRIQYAAAAASVYDYNFYDTEGTAQSLNITTNTVLVIQLNATIHRAIVLAEIDISGGSGGGDTSQVKYQIVTKSTGGSDASITVKKYVDGTLKTSTDYLYSVLEGGVTIDGLISLEYGTIPLSYTYTLLQASTTHSAGYAYSWGYNQTVDFEDTFTVVNIVPINRGGTGNADGYIRTGVFTGSTVGTGSTAEGIDNIISGSYAHAEGSANTASGNYSHAEGMASEATGVYAHAEGYTTTASGNQSHAEGSETVASGDYSHAEGCETVASRNYAHAEGYGSEANEVAAHAGGTSSFATGTNSFAHGDHVNAGVASIAAFGKYNNCKVGDLFEIGNGADASHRSNALEVDASGNVTAGGDVTDGQGNVLADLNFYLEQTVTLSASTETTATFTNAKITTSSVIDIAVSEWGLTPEDVTVTTGVCTVTMPKVSTARSITVRIYVR